jgi:hypothetical protein
MPEDYQRYDTHQKREFWKEPCRAMAARRLPSGSLFNDRLSPIKIWLIGKS